MAIAHPVDEADAASTDYSGMNAIAIPATSNAFQYTDIYDEDIPVAPTLHAYEDNSPAAQVHANAQMLRVGTDIGRTNTRDEQYQIRAANFQSQEKPIIEQERIRAARELAKQRVKEGFDVEEDKYFDKEAMEKEEVEKLRKKQQAEDAARVKKGGGYETSEYDVSSYAGTEYASTYEYKSVYD